MRFISTKTHATLDYVNGILLMVIPLFWLDQAAAPSAIWTPVIVGALMFLQALMTDFEYSLSNSISIPAHLGVDIVAGIVLAASPWIFGFSDIVWIPHVVLGAIEILAALTTQMHRSEPARDRHGRGRQVTA